MKDQQRMKKRMWKPEEDKILKTYVEMHGEGNWSAIPKKLGLRREGKSCRLRWKNYLRPDIKHGGMSQDEEDLILRMHKLIGNRWTLIAGRLPGRTDNEVKNYWNSYLRKKPPKRRTKRKPAVTHIADQLGDNLENNEKRAEFGSEDVGSNQQQANKTNTNMVDVVKEDKLINSNNKHHHDELSKELDDDKYWSSVIVGELGSDAGSLRCGIMDMDFMEDGNQCMIFGGELEGQDLLDHGRYDLFDTFGLNWEDTLPFVMNYS